MKATPPEIRNFSLTDFKALNAQIYAIQNDRHFSPQSMFCRLIRQAVFLLVAAEESNENAFSYRLAMTFSWSLGLVNKLHVDLDVEIKKRPHAPEFDSLSEFQSRLTKSPATPQSLIVYLLRHFASVGEFVEILMTASYSSALVLAGAGLADVVTQMCVLAERSNLNLACVMKEYFRDGCPKCHHIPCNCPFSPAQMI